MRCVGEASNYIYVIEHILDVVSIGIQYTSLIGFVFFEGLRFLDWDCQQLLHPLPDPFRFILIDEFLLLEGVSHLAEGFHRIGERIHVQATAV